MLNKLFEATFISFDEETEIENAKLDKTMQF